MFLLDEINDLENASKSAIYLKYKNLHTYIFFTSDSKEYREKHLCLSVVLLGGKVSFLPRIITMPPGSYLIIIAVLQAGYILSKLFYDLRNLIDQQQYQLYLLLIKVFFTDFESNFNSNNYNIIAASLVVVSECIIGKNIQRKKTRYSGITNDASQKLL